MTTFLVQLIGQPSAVAIDLPCTDLDELHSLMSTTRFVLGALASPDDDGVCRRIIFPAARVHAIMEM